MKPSEKRTVEEIMQKFGASTEESRKAVIEAFGGVEKMELMAELWFAQHLDSGIFVMFSTAVDLGYRIGKKV